MAGAAFSEEAKLGQRAYQKFRKLHRGKTRAEISILWKEHKKIQGMPPPRPSAFSRLSDEEVSAMLQQVEREQDPRYLVSELLRLSQNNPVCFPYGLTPPELRDVAKLQQALYKARGGVFRRRYRHA